MEAGDDRAYHGPMPRTSNRDEFRQGVKDVLAHRAGFRCSKPDCRASTSGPQVAPDGRINVGKAAHITAASPGGPRFDASLTSEQRRSASNGIWLCSTHADEIDRDEERFTVDLLHAWKTHSEEAARAMLGRPVTSSALETLVEVSLHRSGSDGLMVVGETNLPDGTRLMVSLRDPESGYLLGQSKGQVFSRRILIGPFTSKGEPHLQRWYRVGLRSYFNSAWSQPHHVVEMIGNDGENLAGDRTRLTDPEVDDSPRIVDIENECPAPPLSGEQPLSNEEVLNAIKVLRESKLRVHGRDVPVSSAPVKEVVAWFLGTPGLREHKGWSTREISPGIARVSFSFWDGKNPAEALWDVIPRAGEVRYRNLRAKWMSYLPKS